MGNLEKLEQMRREVYSDFQLYAKTCLKIRRKDGMIAPLDLNRAQLYIHNQLEEQLETTGKVRALIPKARQPGCSTYVAARFFKKVSSMRGMRVQILAHRQDASNNLFEIAQRYYDHCPDPVKPFAGRASQKELYFSALDSGYKVSTAESLDVGRSSTVQLFHGSEVAFWPHQQEHKAGIMQAVPGMEGSEIILESTGNGIGEMFNTMCMEAIAGEGEYIIIFIPWFWQLEYRATPPADFELDAEEKEYAAMWELDDAQMYWRRLKIRELGSHWRFKQEYPANVLECFQTSGIDSYIPAELCYEARKRDVTYQTGAKVLGVDPARFGQDRTAFVYRQGRVQAKHQLFHGLDTMQIVGLVVQSIKQDGLNAVFIDIGGLGAGVYDRLIELGYGQIVHSVNFGAAALNKQQYRNKRAEIWGEVKNWLQEAQIEDSDDMQAALTTPHYKYTSSGQLQLESKDDIKKRGLPSPDLADALALTFAMPVVTQDDLTIRHARQQQKAITPISHF